ncbi:MAG: Chitinase 5 [Chaenotheca gracillima]|nr:MAG: Chitinase 5 [Chaenotheca gracillima]
MSHRVTPTAASTSYELGSIQRPYYEALSTADETTEEEDIRKPAVPRAKHGVWQKASLLILCLSIGLNFFLFWHARSSSGRARDQVTYSPAQHLVHYKPVVFASAFGVQMSPFQGKPSEANNQMWEDLYDFGITRISPEEARPMDNQTLPIPGEGGYIVQLAVFHQLHCLASPPFSGRDFRAN